MRVLAWVLERFHRENLTYFVSDGSLIGSIRDGGLPVCHFDAELHVLVMSDGDLDALLRIGEEGVKTGFLWPRHAFEGHHLRDERWQFMDEQVRVDTYFFFDDQMKGNLGEPPFKPTAEKNRSWTSRVKKNIFVLQEWQVFPLRNCSHYGLVLPCPRDSIFALGTTLPGSFRSRNYFVPDRIPVPPLQGSGMTEPNRSSCARIERFQGKDVEDLRGVPRIVLRSYLPWSARAMTCLYDTGYSSLLDYWPTMDLQDRRAVLDIYNEAAGLLPVAPLTLELSDRNATRGTEAARLAASLLHVGQLGPVELLRDLDGGGSLFGKEASVNLPKTFVLDRETQMTTLKKNQAVLQSLPKWLRTGGQKGLTKHNANVRTNLQTGEKGESEVIDKDNRWGG
jgi:hypothetical protein